MIVLLIEGVRPQTQNAREHQDRRRSGEYRRFWAAQVRAALPVGQTIPQTPRRVRLSIQVTYPDRNVPDYDGMVGGLKPLVDALRDLAFIPDDSPWVLQRTYTPCVCPGTMEIEVAIVGVEDSEPEFVQTLPARGPVRRPSLNTPWSVAARNRRLSVKATKGRTARAVLSFTPDAEATP